AERGVLSRTGVERAADAASDSRTRHQRPSRDRGHLQVLRAGAQSRGRARPDRTRCPEHKGNAGMSARIGVVDYGMGNRRSVQKALEHIGATATITHDHEEIRAADALLVPGVGAFPKAMRTLHDLGLADLIRERAAQGTPILGICLGMQLLFERSDELEPTDGLGLIPGEVTAIDTHGLRLPHIGWNEVRFDRAAPLTD